MKKITFIILFTIGAITCNAQYYNFAMPAVPFNRQLFHDAIDEHQNKIIGLACTRDSIFLASNNLDANLQTTYNLKHKIDYLQYYIETNDSLDVSSKFKWLRGIKDVLYEYIVAHKLKKIAPLQLTELIDGFNFAMQNNLAKQPISNVVELVSVEVSAILLKNFALQNSDGIEESKQIILYKICKQNPKKTMGILAQYPNLKKADSLLIDYAALYPQDVYNYAAAKDELGKRINKINNPMIATICQMANSNNGRFYFPFLDDIIAKRNTIENISKTVDNDEAYYKLLTKTLITYENLKQSGKKPLAMDILIEKLKLKSIEIYITPINSLHDEKNLAIRFDKIKNLTPTELYFLAVTSEDEIYTSSFINGVYPKIINGLGKTKADSLFKMTNFCFYRKFIKMCAGYNTLDNFLSKMDRPVAENLMKTFAQNLDQGSNLEDAVDVADSYASITDTSIKRILKNEVSLIFANYDKEKIKSGRVVYGLLQNIFLSYDSSKTPDPAAIFKLPSVFQLSNKELLDSKGKINVQQFFYGDKDGQTVFNIFLNSFRGDGWKIKQKEYWVEVNSTIGTPVTIYANKPLDENQGLDDEAQQKLYRYLDSLNIYPTVVIHRGHSYYVKQTIQQITSYAKLVLLGSCGGYHSLSKILGISPTAQIIASKQIGTGVINLELIDNIMENLRQTKDIDWPILWKQVASKFANNKEMKDRFDDYIPPQKNLGAIFIMAYHKAIDTIK
jgi:hypothetical protein